VITAEEKLKLLAEWAKTIEKLFESEGKMEVDVAEVDHEVELHIKVKDQTDPPPSA
jgi:uncharacterized protein YfcZ (UPF0381/DUF406 family)